MVPFRIQPKTVFIFHRRHFPFPSQCGSISTTDGYEDSDSDEEDAEAVPSQQNHLAPATRNGAPHAFTKIEDESIMTNRHVGMQGMCRNVVILFIIIVVC
jgi:hypothetical protein